MHLFSSPIHHLLNRAVLVWIACCSVLALRAEDGPRFIPNRGQWHADIQYRTPLSGGDIYYTSRGILYAFYALPGQALHPGREQAAPRMFGARQLEGDPTMIRQHHVWVSFGNHAATPAFAGQQALPEKQNYFLGNDASAWAADVPVFTGMESGEVWPGIRMEAGAQHESLKYTWQLERGADPRTIALIYQGADSLRLLPDGSLLVYTPLRTLTETPPVAWQTDGQRQRAVSCRFTLTGNTVGFACEGLSPDLPLTIDPVLIFSTFSGSGADNWGFTATYDDLGNSYGGGIVFNTAGGTYSLTAGAYSSAFQGGVVDMGITKFNASGTALLYSTYLGGNSDDLPLSIVTNSAGELYILGRTLSTNFPSVAGGFDPTHNGGWDLVISRLSTSGNALLGMTYFGGLQDDGANCESYDFVTNQDNIFSLKYSYGDDSRGEIILDHAGNVLIASSTFSFNIPTQNALQNSLAGGQDAMVIKFNATLSNRVWATYLGGPDNDAAYSVQVNNANDVYVTGGTEGGMPLGSTGHQSVYGGGIDGFLAKISANGTQLLGGTYVGTASYDQTFFVQIDGQNRVYVAGHTTSNQFPVLNAGYSQPGGKQFISIFSANLATMQHSTTIGPAASTEPNLSLTAFLVDDCGNIYFSGWGGTLSGYNPKSSGTTGLPVTANALQPTTDGGDFYLAVLGPMCTSLMYGTFFGGAGGQHVDGGTSRFDKRGVVHQAVCGGCMGTTFPTTPGVWSPNRGGPNCNLTIFKMDIGFSGVMANFNALDALGNPVQNTALCEPALVNFYDQSLMSVMGSFNWNFGDGSPHSTYKSPSHTYTAGTYQVQLVITDTSYCYSKDTATFSLTIHAKPVISTVANTSICYGDSLTLTTQTTSVGGTYQWTPSQGLSAATVPAPIAFPQGNTVYQVIFADQHACRDSATVQVSVALPPVVQLPADTIVCKGVAATLAAHTNAVQVEWIPASLYANPASFTPTTATPVMLPTLVGMVGISSDGCRDTTYGVITPFLSSFTLSDDTLCPGETALLTVAGNLAATYQPATEVELLSDMVAVLHPVASGTVTGIITSAQGCRDTATAAYTVLANPQALHSPDTAVCKGMSAPLFAGGGVQYQWSPVHTLSDPTASAPVAATDTTTQYTVIVTDGYGCHDTATVLVTVWPLPVISTTPVAPEVCAGQSVQIKASGAETYQWSPAGTLTFPTSCSCTVLASPQQTTDYVVQGTDSNGCVASLTLPVEVIPLPVATLNGRNETCIGQGVLLLAEGGTSYQWNTGDTTSYLMAQVEGTLDTFWVIPYYRGCAGDTADMVINADFRLPVADFTATPLVNYAPFQVQIQNHSLYATQYFWDFDVTGEQFPYEIGRYSNEAEPSPTLMYAGTYRVRLVVSNGACTDTAYATIIGENIFIALPTIFTPNDDGRNDVFLARQTGIASLKVCIFSRWGTKIYESDQVDFTWDGTYRGELVPEGAYVWTVEAVGLNGMPKTLHGTVIVVR